MKRRKIFVFSGAGVSAESGVKTFRDHDGLWNNFRVEDVATISAWQNNPQPVIDFYNMRRKEMGSIIPNEAHNTIAKLEKDFDVIVVTQNVDDLHEKAGSTNVIHLHGELSKLRSELSYNTKKPYNSDLKLGDVCPNGGQWRPDIVWFGEDLDLMRLHNTKAAAQNCDICIIIGTSMKVSPANTIPWMSSDNAIIYYIDPADIDFVIPKQRKPFFYHIQKPATTGMDEVRKDLKEIFL